MAAFIIILGLAPISLASEEISSLVKQVMPGVVLIKTYDSSGNELSQGSGFVISKEGDVITCYHVMKGYSTAIVNTWDGKEFQVSNVTALRKSDDLARISLSADNYTFVNLNLNITIPEAGQEIVVIGGPLGLEKTVSQGIVSAMRNNTIQITAPTSPGSSGGPVFNMNGEIIGIVSSQMNRGQNLNFAIPACLISTMQPASEEQIDELRSIEGTYYISEEEIHKTITELVEQLIGFELFVQYVDCDILDNNSMLVKIYIQDNQDLKKLRYENVDAIKSSIAGYILAINLDPSIEDMIVQICNSTGIYTTMYSYRYLVNGATLEQIKNDGSMPSDKKYSSIVYQLTGKMLTTMKPVIGGDIRGNPVKGYFF